MNKFNYFSEMQVNKITSTHIRNWQNMLLKSDYKPSTVKLLNSTLKNIFNFAVKYRGLKASPMLNSEPIGTLKGAKRTEIITLEELKQILEATKDKYKLLIKLLFFTGLRIGEALALTIDDIDFKNRTIDINKTLLRIAKVDNLQSPKTESSKRVIAIPDNLANELREHIAKSIYILEGKRIFNIKKAAVYLHFKEITREVLGRDLPIHILRHSHASLLINNGVDVLYISKRLGHSNPTMTLNIYSHLYKQTESKANDLLNEIEMEL